MSYDLVVFDPCEAPKTRAAFLAWDERLQESAGSDDPETLTPPLRAWFLAMIQTFPPLNNFYLEPADDAPRATDYDLNRTAIYAGFPWPQTQAAFDHVIRLAAQHGVGVWNISSERGEIWLPDGRGGLKDLYR